MKKNYHLSIRELVEFILREGDIDSSGGGRLSNERAVLGTRIHKTVERRLEKLGYISEVALKHERSLEEFDISFDGRADAIKPDINNPVIAEIKSTDTELERITESYNKLHWAQAECYAYIYCRDNEIEKCDIKLIYCNIESFASKEFTKSYTFNTLREKFEKIEKEYLNFIYLLFNRHKARNISLKNMKFPFESYREGQRKLAVSVYRAIKSGIKLFAEAPTGIGKTMSTLFPALKTMGEELCDKIFYLTAKTTTRTLPKQAAEILKEKSGMDIISVTLYAKEKICKCAKPLCNPEDCKYSRGHYDRINQAVFDAIASENILDMERINAYADKYTVCPFEYALDLSLWSDLIICDYNYAFDPNVYLRRFFEEGNTERFVFLVDEAHNLADRAREMYSVELDRKDFKYFGNYVKKLYPMLYRAIASANNYLRNKAKGELTEFFGDSYIFSTENDDTFYDLVSDIIAASGDFLDEHPKNEEYDKYLQFYFNLVFYIKLSDMYGSNFCTYYKHVEDGGIFKVLCLDPSPQLKKSFEKAAASILFSATLIPMKYYFNILGGADTDDKLSLPSPFVPENRCIISATDVSASYKKREFYYEKNADYIFKVFNGKRGNYIAFFPSYKYMHTVYEIFKIKYPDVDTVMQSRSATDKERDEFIESFRDDGFQERVGFCVLGGVFSEGIDLKGNRLIGVVLVGTGIPQISVDKELIKEYFNSKSRNNYEELEGFNYSYVYPGFTKILQSAGRVIRSEEDRGVIVLLDERYNTEKYLSLFPAEWKDVHFVRMDEVEDILKDFWRD